MHFLEALGNNNNHPKASRKYNNANTQTPYSQNHEECLRELNVEPEASQCDWFGFQFLISSENRVFSMK